MSASTDKLREDITRYVVALASSGDNFRVQGEQPPIGAEVIENYVNSFVALIESNSKELLDKVSALTNEVCQSIGWQDMDMDSIDSLDDAFEQGVDTVYDEITIKLNQLRKQEGLK